MPSYPFQHDSGAYVTSFLGFAPISTVPAVVTGPSINRVDFNSAKLSVSCGAATGAPTAQTVDGILQHSVDGSTAWADFGTFAITQLTADDTESSVDIDLSNARGFIRAEITVALTAGTTPEIPVAAVISLAGASRLNSA